METLFSFLIKSSTGIVVFYMVYWLFLRKETFYQANRWFLVSALLVSVLAPLFPVHYAVVVEPENNTTIFKTLTEAFKNAEVVSGTEDIEGAGFNWNAALLVIYLTGAGIFLLRLLSQTLILLHIILKYKPKSIKGTRIVENEKYGLPFSFFHFVFINPKFHTQENLPEILAHENVHIRENHWFDLLFIELLTVIFWFNPFIWFFERSIKQNHEYLADKGVISMGHSVGRYQALLLNQLMGMQIIGVTNNLNFALNTNRLKMMTKKKTPRIMGLKFMLAIPVFAVLLYAFAIPDYIQVGNEKSDSVQITQSDKEFTIHGKVVYAETGEPLPGAAVLINRTQIGTVSDVDGTFTLVDPNPTVKSDGSLSSVVMVSFVGLKTVVNTLTTSGSSKNTKFTFQMEDAVLVLYNKNYSGEQSPPPPPPPPPAIVDPQKAKDLIPSTIADEEKEKYFYIVEDYPKYPGENAAMQDYISKMQEKLAQAKNIRGKAQVGFTVNAKGKVVNVKIVEQDNDQAGKAAASIVSGMPDWTPGKQRGKSVSVNYILPLEFK